MSIHWPVTLLVRGSARLFAQGFRRAQRTKATILEAPALEGLLLMPGSRKRFWSPASHILILPTASERPPSILHQESFHSHKVQNQSPNQESFPVSYLSTLKALPLVNWLITSERCIIQRQKGKGNLAFLRTNLCFQMTA